MKLNRLAQALIMAIPILFVIAIATVFSIIGHPNSEGKISLTGEMTTRPEGAEVWVSEAQIVMAAEAKKALVTINGTDELVDIPTIETVDAGKSNECPEGEDCGQGWYVPTDSPAAFRNVTNGQCINTDGAWGSQCWDLGNLFWQNYAGRGLDTCSTGAAKGTIQSGCWQKNAGSNFDMVWDKTKIQAGDWVIFTNGKYGHVGMALGNYNGGYVALFGTNQGGAACSGGGSSANTINKSLGDFAGAFRPKSYVAANSHTPSTPASPQQPTGGSETQQNTTALLYRVQTGDTLGRISLDMGWWPSVVGLYGDSGYAQRLADYNGLVNRGLIYPNQIIRRAE